LGNFGAQFLHFMVVRSKLDGAVGLIISFCPRPPRYIWISFRFQSVVGKA
jgi:hypothetical protein